jgi:hypothetical protein
MSAVAMANFFLEDFIHAGSKATNQPAKIRKKNIKEKFKGIDRERGYGLNYSGTLRLSACDK